ncbi:Pol protein [Phytophthora palmivora]|uniref:Pol protein n=1 Tax=Phytophthora palmivora TaxID=4796 RepID=A0A2P4YS61_9STRA|nr:Pol protein [Phytophthora palmivora]
MASPNTESRRVVWASTAVLDGTNQAGTIDPPAAEAAEESTEGVPCVDVGNIVPRKVEETKKKNESATCVSSVGNRVPRVVKKTSTRAEVSLHTSRLDNQVPRAESETPPARPVDEQYHVSDGVSGRQAKAGTVHLESLPEVSALVNLEELSMKDFLAELKAGEIAEMVFLKPETSPEDLNSSSVMDEDVLEGFTKQPPTILTPAESGSSERDDLVPGSTYCVTRQWSLSREQYKVIDVFFAEKVNGMTSCPAQSIVSRDSGLYLASSTRL